MSELIQQKIWSLEELAASGFAPYQRKKQLVMARRVPEIESPMIIEFPLETLIVDTNWIICYDPGQDQLSTLNDYEHWPVRIDIFERSYRFWDEANWLPTSAQQHLMQYGGKPFFKIAQVWAKKLAQNTSIQSIESPQPVLVPAGFWLLIGASGEPWYIDESTFFSRYHAG